MFWHLLDLPVLLDSVPITAGRCHVPSVGCWIDVLSTAALKLLACSTPYTYRWFDFAAGRGATTVKWSCGR